MKSRSKKSRSKKLRWKRVRVPKGHVWPLGSQSVYTGTKPSSADRMRIIVGKAPDTGMWHVGGWFDGATARFIDIEDNTFETADKAMDYVDDMIEDRSKNVGRCKPDSALGRPWPATESNPKPRAPGTIASFLAVLTSKVTQWDKAQSARESKRGSPNIYRLGLLLAAVDRVRDDVYDVLDDNSPQALEKFRKSVLKHMFADFPPAKATLKQVDQYLATGQAPSLTRR